MLMPLSSEKEEKLLDGSAVHSCFVFIQIFFVFWLNKLFLLKVGSLRISENS